MSKCHNSRIGRTTPTLEEASETLCSEMASETFSSSSESGEKDLLEPVAVIGFSLEFPQDATSPESFWQMLLDGVSASTTIPSERFNIHGFYHADHDRTGTV